MDLVSHTVFHLSDDDTAAIIANNKMVVGTESTAFLNSMLLSLVKDRLVATPIITDKLFGRVLAEVAKEFPLNLWYVDKDRDHHPLFWY